MQITLGTQYNMSGRNDLKKNQNAPRPSEHPRVIKASTGMILVHVQKMYNIFRILTLLNPGVFLYIETAVNRMRF